MFIFRFLRYVFVNNPLSIIGCATSDCLLQRLYSALRLCAGLQSGVLFQHRLRVLPCRVRSSSVRPAAASSDGQNLGRTARRHWRLRPRRPSRRGCPPGICTVDRSASMPPKAARFTGNADHGQRGAGSNVPLPDELPYRRLQSAHRSRSRRALRGKSPPPHPASGVPRKCAFRKGICKASEQYPPPCVTTGRSLSLPMTIPDFFHTAFPPHIPVPERAPFRYIQKSAQIPLIGNPCAQTVGIRRARPDVRISGASPRTYPAPLWYTHILRQLQGTVFSCTG